MRIERLNLVNFRNYQTLDIDFNKNINIFIGNNGVGKTNILESIYLLALSKSNKAGIEENIIKFNEEIAKITGSIKCDELLKKMEIHITRNKKSLFINGKEIKKSRNYISNFYVISFSPLDLEIIKGSPNIRRNIMNIDISQLFNNYILFLNQYNQIIKIRNEYLKRMNINGNNDSRYLDVINNEMIDKALKIYEYRFKFVDYINMRISSIFKKITNLDGLNITYNSSIGINYFNESEIREKYEKKLKKLFNVELSQGMSLFGPHRDDFSFMLNEVDMKLFSSQGQQRLAVIALKISEIYLFKEITGEYPVLLLDDIFSEIDNKKRNKIIKFLNNDIQSIITTTDIDDIKDSLLENATVFDVKNDMVKKRGKIKWKKK